MKIATGLENLPDRAGAILGDRSLLCQELRQASKDGFAELADQLRLVQSSHINDIEKVISKDWVRHETTWVLAGLQHSLGAADTLRNHGNGGHDIAKAIEAFDRAWPITSPVDVVAGETLTRTPSDVEKAMAAVTSPRTPLGYWVVYDLLDRWLNAQGDLNANGQLATLHATTPILGASNFTEDGAVIWLTVELFRCAGGGPFCPDPWHLGLTSINSGADRFIEALEKVWRLSGLGPWFRGRWRVTFQHPLDQTRDYKPDDLKSFTSLAGQSAQIAALVALLAASGDPYRDNPDQEPKGVSEPLAADIGISACIGAHDATRPLIELRIDPVTSVPQKLDAAKLLLNTVLLAKKQTLSEALQAVKDEARKAEQRPQVFAGLHLEEVGTLAEALDLMLVTNRHLARYQSEVRDRWLCQWEGNTGKADADKGKWDRDMAAAAREKFSHRGHS